MSCGCKTSEDSTHSCGIKNSNGCENVDTCGNSYKLSVFDWLSHVHLPDKKYPCDFVEVRFKNERKCFYHNANQLPLYIGSVVVVGSDPGYDIGVVTLKGELVKIQMKKKRYREENLLKVYRVATQRDIDNWQELREKEERIKLESRKIAKDLGLGMKITDVEYQGDGGKVIFYYTSEGRVDFRQLIKEYAQAFRTRVDMKQIGFRQETAKIGGIGLCGRELCCSSWLTDFRSVNTNAARYQQLSINPQKLAGQCGKLKCCLNFELDNYMEALSFFPATNTMLDTEKGKAFCIKIDVFKKKMWFAYVGNSVMWYDISIDDVKRGMDLNEKGKKIQSLEDLKSMGTTPPVKVDLIQENRVDRFEKKNKRPYVNKKSEQNKLIKKSLNLQEIEKENKNKSLDSQFSTKNSNKKRYSSKRNDNT